MIDYTSLTTIFMSPVIGIVSRCDLLIKACHSPAGKPENCSLFDKSTKIGMHVTLIIL